MDEGRELHRGREGVEDPNAPAARCSQCAAKIVDESSAIPRSTIAALSDAVLVPGSPVASPGSASGSPSVCSTSYLGIRQAGHGNAFVAEGDTLMTRIRRARGDAFRTGLPPDQKR
jgi:hypothetical protein